MSRSLLRTYGEVLSCNVTSAEWHEPQGAMSGNADALRGSTLFVIEVTTERGPPEWSGTTQVRRRFADFEKFHAALKPLLTKRAAGPGGGAGRSCGFDPMTFCLPPSVTTFYKNDPGVVEERRQGLQKYLDTAVEIQEERIASLLRLFFFAPI